ncbi:uncharacterized protein A1O9_02736 [Exophiala aquamarina CBS 119918]|uniref:Pheromone a factor receptor n=1 Tax=Exophiala aquamarina CBS 119918 TaxID=1182545 RepID=A0A072PMS0_9EURO|nr:uncharacterized protein A1O9_02736 [Exophiala aquamarina CBS 119918]KEF61171.1 hypothetical protein A1O9_02736 [Exophiala aquamarina CBS 119918]
MVLNLQTFVNALIWPAKDLEASWDGRILCDIEIKLWIGLSMAVVGAITSILRQTAIILDTTNITLSPSLKELRRKAIFEGTFCVAIPVIMMPAQYIVQPERYWILPVVGCTASFDSSWMTVFLMWMPPTVVSITGSIYCGLVILRMQKQRKENGSALALPGVATTSGSHFTRLSSLALTLFLFCFPLGIYGLVLASLKPGHPFSWKFIHGPDWKGKIYKISGAPSIPIDRWLQIGIGFLCFAFFGVGTETIEAYRSRMRWMRQGMRTLVSRGTTRERHGI